MASPKKLILVVGATGAQGLPVVASLLAPSKDGTPSPYAVRALTRDPTSERAVQLKNAGAELFKGSFENIQDIIGAYQGCYGAFINTDTFTVGQQREIYAAIQWYEYAHREGSMRHFVWSGLDYSSKLGSYQLKYKAEHLDAKGIFNDFLRYQPSVPEGDGLTWSIVTTGPYIEGLRTPFLGPLKERDENGAVVFAIPVGNGHVPIISLRDIGWWVRYTFDHRAEQSGKELKIATEMLNWDTLAETFTRVTGIPSVHKRLEVDEYLDLLKGLEAIPVAEEEKGRGPSVRDTFSGMYWTWRDNLLTRDMDWLRKVYPEGYTLESWIRETGYDGSQAPSVLKGERIGAALRK
ncbi:hypothetical protein Moror_5971 [Moniliophthora roreri MCA 2997]|uniref:NmrA-like domain-containing protein n=1 Tax=Moniliophthora roreri (strain MCA 2997) TaxID=1381753 RepID=V2Y129_MONRO|nr:hypothetical protein Moror_5971 [Moniliophthora roreri MCA 2997]